MLELRPNCECCDADLPGDSCEAFICSFECTFCRNCTERACKAVARTALASCCRARHGLALR